MFMAPGGWISTVCSAIRRYVMPINCVMSVQPARRILAELSGIVV